MWMRAARSESACETVKPSPLASSVSHSSASGSSSTSSRWGTYALRCRSCMVGGCRRSANCVPISHGKFLALLQPLANPPPHCTVAPWRHGVADFSLGTTPALPAASDRARSRTLPLLPTALAPGSAFMTLHWSELFGLSVAPLELVVRGSALYLFLLVLFRVVIKRRM